MATPCNDISECVDGSDESECHFPDWYSYSILSLALVVLGITCYVSLRKHVKKAIQEIMQDTRWRLATENENRQIVYSESEKLMKMAYHAENCNVDEINKILSNEMNTHGNEARLMCCLKVSNFREIFPGKRTNNQFIDSPINYALMSTI